MANHRKLKKYWAVAKTVWQELVEYRINFFLEIISLTISFTVIIFIWSIIYGQEGNQTLAGFSYSEIITYLILSGLLQGTLLVASQGDDVNNDIKQGALSITKIGKFPTDIYSKAWRVIFTLIIPLAALGTVPAQAFLTTLPWKTLLYILLFTIVSFPLALQIWKINLRKYSSASS